MALNRRHFLASAAATGSLLCAPAVLGQAKPKVVIIGGGPGGATAARYLAKDGRGAIDVTLVEAKPVYTTCFFSNLYLGGLQPFEVLQHGYDELVRTGVTVVQGWAAGVDRDKKTVALDGGRSLAYDRLVLSPGIDFVEGSVAGWSEADAEVMPHAYKAGPQTQLLKAQIEAMPEGGIFALIAPPNPYRCPPAPYERASMIAFYLSRANPTAKILIVDPKDHYSKQTLFENGWLYHYDHMIEWIGPDFGGDTIEVRPGDMEIEIDGEVQSVDVCNVIPAQKAGIIAQMAGVTDDSGWAPVDPFTMKSRVDGAVYVLGDSSAQGDMPKSGVAANSQAKVAVHSILGELAGALVPPAKYLNTCWSAIAEGDGVKVGAIYEPTSEKIASVENYISQPGETPAVRKATYDESFAWYVDFTSDVFG